MRIIVAILLICASSLSSNAQVMPNQGTSQIVFLRPLTGTAIMDGSRSVILRIQEQDSEPLLVGIGGGGTKIIYRVNPGLHTFAAVGGNADFMVANVLPNTTYYVLVQYMSGRFRSQYSFKSVDSREQNSKEFKDSLAAAKSVENDPAAANWLTANMPSVKQRLRANYGPWQQKPSSEKVILGEPLGDAAQRSLLVGGSVSTPTAIPPSVNSAMSSQNTAPTSAEISADKLRELYKLYKEGVINQKEYEVKKQEILKGM